MRTSPLHRLRCLGPRTLFTALAALVALAMIPTSARATTNPCAFALSETKSCVSPRLVGQTNDCTITLSNIDVSGNSYTVNSSKDLLNTSGGTATGCTQVTDSGLKISAVSGNTTCTVGATGGCVIGPSCGTGGVVATCLDLTTGPYAAGKVEFEDTGYTIVQTDTNIGTGGSVCGAAGNSLNDQGTINVSDNCNVCNAGTVVGGSCSTAAVDENTTQSTIVDSCSVSIVKQISCDGGASWKSPPVSGPACTGFLNDPIEVRYKYEDTGNVDLNSCNIHDVTGSTGSSSGGTEYTSDTTVGTITAGSGLQTSSVITTGPAPTSATLTCSPAGPNIDTAEIDCSCTGFATTVKSDSTNNFTCETCGVSIDKQVQCNGKTYDVSCAGSNVLGGTTPDACDPNNCGSASDPTCLQDKACIGFNAYCSDGSAATCSTADPPVCTCPAGTTLVPAQNVKVAYVIDNTGQDTVSCSGAGLGFSDTDVRIAADSSPAEATLNGTFTSGATQTIFATDPCSPALGTEETSGDTASLACTCNALLGNTLTKTVTGADSAIFSCQQPTLQLTKTCLAQGSGGVASDVSPVVITATNSGTAPLTSCAVTDAYDTNVSCPQTAPGANSSVVSADAANPSANPASFTLAASGGTDKFDSNITGLTANACNIAQISCNVDGGSEIISATANATCPVGKGCETRTPGFWKNRPELSATVIAAALKAGTDITSCGLDLDSTSGTPDCSTTVDMCQLGSVAHSLNIDPVQSNLIFQCAAAELNIAVTGLDGGQCANTIPGSDLTFATCCGDGGVCATGNTALLDACQTAVGNFNSLFENCPDPTNPLCTAASSYLSNPGSADPTPCQAVTSVNDIGGVGAPSPVPDCSDTGRLYLLKKTGKH